MNLYQKQNTERVNFPSVIMARAESRVISLTAVNLTNTRKHSYVLMIPSSSRTDNNLQLKYIKGGRGNKFYFIIHSNTKTTLHHKNDVWLWETSQNLIFKVVLPLSWISHHSSENRQHFPVYKWKKWYLCPWQGS